MAAMSINLSAHYEATINTSINQAREEHRKFTESVLDALPVSLYVIDRDYRIVMWNRHREIGTQGMPRDAVIGRNVFQVLAKYPHSKLSKEFERAFRTGKIERIEQRTTDEDGTTKHWMVSKVPMRDEKTNEITHVITVGEDVTVRVEAIHAVGRAEKLAAVGRLAAGVVHEINNPLATISACAESLESRVEEGEFGESAEIDDLHEYLGLIRSEAFRCKSITNGLLDFSRMRSANRMTIDIGEICHSSARLITHQKRGENIEINFEIGENLPLVNADGGQIQQAIIALATNAIDAMPERRNADFSRVCTDITAWLSKLRIRVSASRRKICRKFSSRFLRPKKSAKERDSDLRSATASSPNTADVSAFVQISESARLSRFFYRLQNRLVEAKFDSKLSKLSDSKLNIMAKLLVVDDENNLRLVVQKELSRQGHEVETASDGEAAWGILEHEDFDVLLCDINMPRLDGMGFCAVCAKKRQNPPEVIMLTGHATVETAIEAMKLGAYDYLTKPYRITELAALVTQAAEKQKLKIDNQRLRAQIERTTRNMPEIVAESPQMKEVLRLVQRVAHFRHIGFDYGRIGNGKRIDRAGDCTV